MSDHDPFCKPNLQPPPLSIGQPGEKLFEFLVGYYRHLFELRDHGKVYGIECQIFKNEEFWAGDRFDPRLDASRPSHDLAIRWEQETPRAQEHESWAKPR
jgi:hypothetical protein